MNPQKSKAVYGVIIATVLMIVSLFVPDAETMNVILEVGVAIAGAFGITGIRQMFNDNKPALQSKTVWGVLLVLAGFLNLQLLPLLAVPDPWPLVVTVLLSAVGTVLASFGLIKAVEKNVPQVTNG